MNVENPQTCEECLSLLTGIIIPRPKVRLTGSTDFGFHLKTEDATILISIAKQLSKGIAMTDRQYALVKKKLSEYETQFDDKNIDVISISENLLYELREIDRSHWIKVLHWKDEDILGIRFPFNKKVIKHLDELKKLQKTAGLAFKENTHYFKLNLKNIYNLVRIAKRFDNKFDIQSPILDVYEQLKKFDENVEDYVSGIYNLKLKNLPDSVIDTLENELGPVSKENYHLYYDRRLLYGIENFDNIIDDIIMKQPVLVQQLLKRDSGQVIVKKEKFNLNNVCEAIYDLKRFPIIVVLSDKTAHDQLVETYRCFRNFIADKEISVLFRHDGQSEFNNFIKENKINNPVDKSTKVVYINNKKLPKPLLKAEFTPRCSLCLDGSSLSYNHVMQYIQNLDLQIILDDKGSIGSWSRFDRKYSG